jgi:hypothetical protein
MPTYKVHYFFIRRPNPPTGGTTGPRLVVRDEESPPPAPTAPPTYSQFLVRFRAILQNLFEQAVPHIPGNDATNPLGWSIQVSEIPQTSPGVPNFSGYAIQNFEPIIYLCGTAHAAASHNRRAIMTMLDALRDGNFQNIPAQNLSQTRQALQVGSPHREGGRAIILWDSTNPTDDMRFAPVAAEVYTNLTQASDPNLFGNMTRAEMARNWVEVMSNFLARTSFHEIAHCKAESYNRPTGTLWSSPLPGSIHNESGVGICGATVAYNTSPEAADYTIMGSHMLCPMPFYRLDEPISPQCTDHGSPHPLTAASAPAAPRQIPVDSLDDI